MVPPHRPSSQLRPVGGSAVSHRHGTYYKMGLVARTPGPSQSGGGKTTPLLSCLHRTSKSCPTVQVGKPQSRGGYSGFMILTLTWKQPWQWPCSTRHQRQDWTIRKHMTIKHHFQRCAQCWPRPCHRRPLLLCLYGGHWGLNE